MQRVSIGVRPSTRPENSHLPFKSRVARPIPIFTTQRRVNGVCSIQRFLSTAHLSPQRKNLALIAGAVRPIHRREIKEKGEQGFRKFSVIQKALDVDSSRQWEETWWEASDWNGLRELGARKSCIESTRHWTEQWLEKLYFDRPLHAHVIFKTCKKWCKVFEDDVEEWEEEWEEYFIKDGRNTRWSKKWGRKGDLLWHENWGDDIDAEGNGNLWTDKWCEDVIEGEGKVHWGEKWKAILKDKYELSRSGESWRKSKEDYSRWWSEHKSPKNHTITKTGHSTTGEHWDVTEALTEDAFAPVIDTNRYELAIASSPQLLNVKIAQRAWSFQTR